MLEIPDLIGDGRDRALLAEEVRSDGNHAADQVGKGARERQCNRRAVGVPDQDRTVGLGGVKHFRQRPQPRQASSAARAAAQAAPNRQSPSNHR